jgi:hypothetical protein
MVPPCGTLSAITRMSTVVSVLVSVVLVYWRPRPFGPSLRERGRRRADPPEPRFANLESGHCAGSPCTQAQRRSFSSPVMVRPRGGLGLFVLCRMAGRAGVCPPRLTPSYQTPSVLGRVSWRLVRDARLKRQSDGQRVPSAQVLDRLAVLPLDGVLEKVSKSAAGGDAGDVGHAAACAHGDDEAFVMEGECLQRPLL